MKRFISFMSALSIFGGLISPVGMVTVHAETDEMDSINKSEIARAIKKKDSLKEADPEIVEDTLIRMEEGYY